MRLLSFLIVATTVGCSKVATVPVNLSAAQGSATTAIAQQIELKHEEDGWVKVPAKMGDAKVEKFTSGKSIAIATAEIPKGRYTAVKATFSVPGKMSTKGFGSGDRPSGNQNSARVEYEVSTKTEFCAKGKKDNDITLTITQNADEAEPTIKVGQRPACK